MNMRNFRCLISTILQHGNKVPWSRETANHPYLSPSLACVPCIKEMQYKNHNIWFSIKLRTRPNQYTCYWWINCYNTSSYLIDSWCKIQTHPQICSFIHSSRLWLWTASLISQKKRNVGIFLRHLKIEECWDSKMPNQISVESPWCHIGITCY